MAEGGKSRIECDVTVVGAGPVGAALAGLLAQAGVSVFIGEAGTEIYPLPRAAHFDHEIMRIFQQLGIAGAIAPSIVASDRYTFQNRVGDILLDFDLRQPADTGWRSYMMNQPGIERALRGMLEASSRVDLRTGVAFGKFEQGRDRVVSSWEGPDGGFTVSSKYLVGCDGGSSPVRTALDIDLDDLAFDEPWLVLDLIVDPENDLPVTNIQYCDPERPTTYVVMGENRRRFEFMLKPGETPENIASDQALAQLLAPWSTRGIVSVERRAVYRFHALIAREWWRGRVLIAGDAAHQMPPFAGQGMCSGIRDAAALAWRLPLALAGAQEAHLLGSYQREREPHVRTITGAAIATGRVVCILDPAAATARDAQLLAARAAGAPLPDISSPPLELVFGLPETPRAGTRFFQPLIESEGQCLRLDDVLGAGAWLIRRDAGSGQAPPPGVRCVSLTGAALAPWRAVLAEWLDAAGAQAVLVRADRYVFGTGAPGDLLAAFAAQLAGAIEAPEPQPA